MTPDEIDHVVETESHELWRCVQRWDGLRDQLAELRRLVSKHGPEPIRHMPWERPLELENQVVEAWIRVHVERGQDDPGDDLLLSELAPIAAGHGPTAGILLRCFGARARPLALPLARRLQTGGAGGANHAFGLTAIHWGLRGWTLPDVLAIAASTGVVSSAPVPDVQAMVNVAGPGAPDPVIFYRVLDEAGVVLGFDPERGGENHELVACFGGASGGVFTPTQLSQSPRRPAPGRPTYEVVDVSFTWQGTTTTFTAEHLGDLVDDRAVARAVNGALAGAGRPERFFQVAEGDISRYLFGDAAAVARLREELLLFLDDGHGAVDEAEHRRLKQRLIDALQ